MKAGKTQKPREAAFMLAPLGFDAAVRAALATGRFPPMPKTPKRKKRKAKK